jgi:hypothetical protein
MFDDLNGPRGTLMHGALRLINYLHWTSGGPAAARITQRLAHRIICGTISDCCVKRSESRSW